MSRTIRIGTRGSPLALWQANHISEKLRALGQNVELVIVRTRGDVLAQQPLTAIGGEGLFTKAIQDAVLRGEADLAVHSLKDLPTTQPEGLTLAAVPSRASPFDVFVSERHRRFDELPAGAVLATGSQRRRAMIRYRRPDLQLVELRGNVDTRLRKLQEEEWDGMILAEAALRRLGRTEVIAEVLDGGWMLPAVGQGALGLECRTDDTETRETVARLNDPASFAAVTAERSFLAAMGGGCAVPLGALAVVDGSILTLTGSVLDPKGHRRLDARLVGPVDQAIDLGRQLAAEILAKGGQDVLRGVDSGPT
ncbi:MAG: hydroxymethylbilane synthase [Nitrospira sp.]|nr:hydroxymethylbilane synthase [Nitrospira sp.]